MQTPLTVESHDGDSDVMISARWLAKRKPYWDRLEVIIKKAGRQGLGGLAHAELRELGLLYRQIAADLASVREDPLSQPWAVFLNQLLARAHNLIYMGSPRPSARHTGILLDRLPPNFSPDMDLYGPGIHAFSGRGSGRFFRVPR